ncbi:hypothetical protein K438DRAFT_1815315 [Mycena galopus ATCC 62051]|nr:hypothetical protein K438DRAFT_1815315 [Mycena galopus ATCC 62051]
MASFYEMNSNGGDDALYFDHAFAHVSVGYHSETVVCSKRRQVKIACEKCKKSCKKYGKYGWPEECVDSKRKEREKGANAALTRKRHGHPYEMGVYTWPLPSGLPSTTPAGYAAGHFNDQLPFSSGDNPENPDGPSQLDAV